MDGQIERVTLDVCDEKSIAKAVEEVESKTGGKIGEQKTKERRGLSVEGRTTHANDVSLLTFLPYHSLLD